MLSLSAVHGKTAAPLRFFMVGLLAAFATGSARADEPVSFKGKTVTMIIGFAAGGGTDLAGRLIAAHLGKYLPGKVWSIAAMGWLYGYDAGAATETGNLKFPPC